MVFGDKKSGFGLLIAIVLAFVGVIWAINYGVYKLTYEQVYDVYVNDRERVTTKSGNDVNTKYLIFTENEVFENIDSLIALKFNSSDIYNHIKPGYTCNLEVTGLRLPFLSMYRNIISASCSKE